MGMTPSQYWDEAPSLATAYRQAHRLRREAENELAWLQGLYMYDAFGTVLANAFARRGAKRVNYMEKPIDIFPLPEEEKQRRMQAENEKMQSALKAMMRKQRSKGKQKG